MKVIVDIDNTLSLSNKRFELAKTQNGKIDWNVALNPELVKKDEPNLPMIDLVSRYKHTDTEIIIITGRPESIKESTEWWLKTHNIEYDKLFMRTEKDHYIKASILKKNIYETYVKSGVFCAYDDEEEIIQMWNQLGIPTFKVNGSV